MQPKHPLLGDLQRGFSKFNVIFLKHALDALPKVEAVKTSPIGEKEAPSVSNAKNGFDASNPVIAALMREQSDLFAVRGRLSNSLHQYPFTAHYDEKRGVIMDKIKIVQRKIAKVMHHLIHAREYGILPPEKLTYPVPHDPAERERKKVSLRGSISHKRNDLALLRGGLAIDEAWEMEKIAVFLEEMPLQDALKEKILRGYDKLNQLKKHLENVEKAIEADHIHAD